VNDLLFVVADRCMAEAVAGLLERDQAHLIIGCRQLSFDSRRDIKVADGLNDAGLYVRAHVMLRHLAAEYRHAVVIVDEEWDGSPGAGAIEERLWAHLAEAGWASDAALALVVCPEADVWLWSDSPHSAMALGWASWTELRPALEEQGWLVPGQAKPKLPKAAAEWALKHCGRKAPRSAALYRQVASNASVRRCEDAALERLLNAIRAWFPVEGA
jgi:hypothetical protein